MEKLYLNNVDKLEEEPSLEAYDEELQEMQVSIEADINSMSIAFNTLDNMSKTLSVEELKAEGLDVALNDAKVMCGTVNNYRVQLGLEANSMTDTDDGTLLHRVGVEDLKETLYKTIDGIRRLFIKIVTRIKKFIIKIVNNGGRLKKRLDKIEAIIISVNNMNNADELTTAHISEIKSMFTTITHLSDGKAFYNKSADIARDTLIALIPHIGKYQPTLGHIDILEKMMAGKTTAEDLEFDISNIESFKSLDTLLMKKYKEKYNVEPTSITTVGYYNDVLEGIVEVPDSDGKNSLDWIKFSGINEFDSSGELFSKIFSKENIGDIATKLGDPRDVLKEMNNNGKTDIKAGDMLFKSVKNFEQLDAVDKSLVEKAFRTSVSIIPNNVNANVINYFRNVTNIIRLLEIHLSYKIKRGS